MKETLTRDTRIFRLWAEQGLTISRITRTCHPEQLSLKRVRNIIYGGETRLRNDFERTLYRIYLHRLAICHDTASAIRYTHEHQPPRRYSERTVRRIITARLRSARQKNK